MYVAGEARPRGTGERWVAGLYPAGPGAAEQLLLCDGCFQAATGLLAECQDGCVLATLTMTACACATARISASGAARGPAPRSPARRGAAPPAPVGEQAPVPSPGKPKEAP